MRIDYDCKQLVRLREELGLDIDDGLAASMSLTTKHLIALEKNDVSFYRSEVLFLTSLKKYITLLGGNPKVMIKNLKELEQRKLIKKIEQPSQKRSWWQKIADDWLLQRLLITAETDFSLVISIIYHYLGVSLKFLQVIKEGNKMKVIDLLKKYFKSLRKGKKKEQGKIYKKITKKSLKGKNTAVIKK